MILNYLQTHIIEIIGIVLSGFIAYHIFFLSRRISNSAKLEHKENIKEKTLDLLSRIHKSGLRSEVYLVNINRYFRDYPDNKEKLISGYSHIKGEVKAVRYNGVEFFCSMPAQAYYTEDGEVTLKADGNQKAFRVHPVGLVPYKWIEYVDLDGDEYAYVPLFYCKFKGKIYWRKWWRKLLPFGYPYKELYYYKERDNYREDIDPEFMRWQTVHIK